MRFTGRVLWILALVSRLGGQAPPASNLALGTSQQAVLTGDQVQKYLISSAVGRFNRVWVARPNVPIVVRLLDPAGVKLMELHWPADSRIPEPVCWIADQAGQYRIEISADAQSPAGSQYSISLAELRDRLADDAKHLALQRLFEAARSYDQANQSAEAIPVWEQARALSRELNDREREAAALNGLGGSYVNLSQHQKGFAAFEQALALHRELKDRLQEGRALRNMGSARSNLSQFDEAIVYHEQALAIAREVRDRNGEGRALGNLGLAASNLSQFDKAIELYRRSLEILREVHDRNAEARILNSLGGISYYTGLYEQAIGYYEQGAAIARETRDRRTEGRALGNLGAAYADIGQLDKALGYYQQGLAMRREVKDRNDEANALLTIASAYFKLSLYEDAIRNYEQAVAIFRELKARIAEGNALLNFGAPYRALGRAEIAIGLYDLALSIAVEVKDRRGEGEALNYLGDAYSDLHQYAKAIGYHKRALVIARAASDRRNEGDALNFLGSAHSALQDYKQATTYFEQALAVRVAIKDRRGEASTLSDLGGVRLALGKRDKAVGYYGRALAIARQVKARDIEARTLNRLMNAWKSAGRINLAIFYGKQSVNVIQAIRSDIRGLSKDLQASFLKGNEDPYHTLAALLIRQGRLSEAEQILGLLKDQEFFEFIRRDSTEAGLSNGANLTPDEIEWAKRYSEIGDRLIAIGNEHGELQRKTTLTPSETQRLTKLEQDLAAGNHAFERFLDDLSNHFAAKADTSARVEQLRETQGFMADLAEMPAGSVAIYTLVGEDSYRAILITANVQKAFEYPIKGADLNLKVLEFREVIRNPNLDPRPRAQELFKILIGSMAKDLEQAHARTVMFALDGTLRYLPLGALYDGSRYLIERYQLSVFTPASNARLKDPPAAQWRAAGFGVTKAFAGSPALPSVASEMNGIIMSSHSDGVLPGELRLDDDFTQDSLKTTLRKTYPVVHIASHFKFQPGNDASSFLLLGDGSHFSLSELRNTRNLFAGVQLLTLSACNTGVGDVPGDGKEVEGFGVLAQRQGAKSVIASLWPVADESTSILMREFYRIRESGGGMTKAGALAAAQIELLRGTAKSTSGVQPERAMIHEEAAGQVSAPRFIAPADAPYAHPYFWAPFFLMGNWL